MAAPDGLVPALRAAGIREVDDSAVHRAAYASDASLYRVLPRVVVRPRDADEIEATLEVCRQLRVPLTPRGAGTSIAGNAVGPGVVLDLARHLNRLVALDPEAGTATVQPGVVHATLQAAAAGHGWRYGPDPSSHTRCTIGGMIGTNACGSRALAYGRTADTVLGLDAVTGTGERLRLGSHAGPAGAVWRGSDEPAGTGAPAGLDAVVRAGLGTIRTELGRFGRQGSGYALEHLLPERGADLARALVGSEGTLAVVRSATVRLVREPAARLLVVLGYPDMAAAADAVPAVLGHRPTACEGLDARIVDAVRARHGPAAVPQLPRGGGWLFVELAGDSPGELDTAARQLLRGAGTLQGLPVPDPRAAAALWRIREDGAGLASRTPSGRPAYPGWEDAAVPPASLGTYLRGFEQLLAGHGLTGMPYGHFGDGCVHVRLDFPLEAPDGAQRMRAFVLDAARLVTELGGSLSGEHGDGRSRSELLPLLYSDAALRLFGAVKAVFDPDGVLNPGVLVAPRPLTADLRTPRTVPATGLALRADRGDLGAAVHRCTGVGSCRADPTAAGGAMCPSYLATREEKDSTRGRARVLQEMLDGSAVTGGWRSPEVREALELCLACKACSRECPTGVDMATYKAEVLYRAHRYRLRPRSHYALGALPRWARLAALAPASVNATLAAPGLGALALGLAGVDGRRSVPRFAPTTFHRAAAGRSRPAADGALELDGPAADRRVLLWVDTFTDHFAPQVAVAAVRVLQAAGHAVVALRRPACCGLTWITTGQLDTARRVLARTARRLQPFAVAGVPIVGLEPSCTAVWRSDAGDLLPAGLADQLGVATSTLAEVLAASGWTPPSLAGREVLAQPHCHHAAVLGWDADAALLAAAGARVQRVGGCCGLAGSFGMERGHHDVSVAVAEHALLPAARARPDATVLADGFSCRTQLADLAGRRSWHLAELLAAALPTPQP